MASKCTPGLTLLDAGLATVQKINPIVSLWDDVLYYGEDVQDVLFGEHRSVLDIKLILSDKKLNSGYVRVLVFGVVAGFRERWEVDGVEL